MAVVVAALADAALAADLAVAVFCSTEFADALLFALLTLLSLLIVEW